MGYRRRLWFLDEIDHNNGAVVGGLLLWNYADVKLRMNQNGFRKRNKYNTFENPRNITPSELTDYTVIEKASVEKHGVKSWYMRKMGGRGLDHHNLNLNESRTFVIPTPWTIQNTATVATTGATITYGGTNG